MRKLRLHRRLVAAVGIIAVVAVAVVGAAIAGHETTVPSYTGCLTNSGGTVNLLRAGNSPARACPSGSTQIHLSGGDITSLTVGSGLTGGGTQGALSIGLNAQQVLPSCASDQIPKWNGTAWACGSDNDTQYTAGIGLQLNNQTEFAIDPEFRLPRSCSTGDVPAFDRESLPLTWHCSTPSSPLQMFAAGDGRALVPMPHLDFVEVARVTVPAGRWSVTADGHFHLLDNSESAGCGLYKGEGQNTLLSAEDVTPGSAGAEAPTDVTLMDVEVTDGPTVLHVNCNTNGTGVSAAAFVLQAIGN